MRWGPRDLKNARSPGEMSALQTHKTVRGRLAPFMYLRLGWRVSVFNIEDPYPIGSQTDSEGFMVRALLFAMRR